MTNYSNFFLHSSDILIIVDLEGRIKDISPSAERVLGYTQANLLGKSFLEFLHNEDYNRTITRFEKLKEGQNLKTFWNRWYCKHGKVIWILWSGFIKDGLVYGIGKDITPIGSAIERLSRIMGKFRNGDNS